MSYLPKLEPEYQKEEDVKIELDLHKKFLKKKLCNSSNKNMKDLFLIEQNLLFL